MSHRIHALLGVAVEFFGFLGGLYLSLALLGNPAGPLTWIPWFLMLAMSALIPRGIYRRLVPARCPKCAVPRAYLRGTKPWRYECRACGHVHHTSMSDGGGPPAVSEEAEEEPDGRP